MRARRQALRAAEVLRASAPIDRLQPAPPGGGHGRGHSRGSGVELRTDARLAEGSFGSWEGRTRGEVLALGPADAALLGRWEADPSVAPPGGESMAEVQRRVAGLADELAREFPGGAVVLVSHVGPIKALAAAVLGVPLAAARRLFLDPGTISVVEWGPRPLLRLFNSHAHLGWTSARWMS